MWYRRMVVTAVVVLCLGALADSSVRAEAASLDFTILALTCQTDPGPVGLAQGGFPEDCARGQGVGFEILDRESGALVAICSTGADGTCTVPLPEGALVTVYENVATVPTGSWPRENPVRTQVMTEFAGAAFVNILPQQPAPPAQPADEVDAVTHLPNTGGRMAADDRIDLWPMMTIPLFAIGAGLAMRRRLVG
jgi:hypothetical protein